MTSLENIKYKSNIITIEPKVVKKDADLVYYVQAFDKHGNERTVKELKTTAYHKYHDTFKEAKEFLINKVSDQIKVLEEELADKRMKLKKVKALQDTSTRAVLNAQLKLIRKETEREEKENRGKTPEHLKVVPTKKEEKCIPNESVVASVTNDSVPKGSVTRRNTKKIDRRKNQTTVFVTSDRRAFTLGNVHVYNVPSM